MTTIIVDPASCSAKVSGVVCLGTNFDFELKYADGVTDSETTNGEIVIVLFSDENVALTIPPTVSSELNGRINLATDEAVALFADRKPIDKVVATIGIWNATDRRMLGTGPITIKNNPFVFSTNSVNEMILAAFAARVAVLESQSGKVEHNMTGDWVKLYATGDGEAQQLTFEA